MELLGARPDPIRGQLRQRSNELTVKMTNLTSNTRQPLGVAWREGVRCWTKWGKGKAKGGWFGWLFKKKALREGPVEEWRRFRFFCLGAFWWLTIFVFLLNSGWCFRDKPSTGSALITGNNWHRVLYTRQITEQQTAENKMLLHFGGWIVFFWIFKSKCFTISGLQLNLLCVCFILGKLRFSRPKAV